MKNLILSALWDSDFQAAEPFVGSIIQSGYRGDVVMFVDGVPDTDIARLKSNGVNVIRMPAFDRGKISGNGQRYKYYWEYLDRTPGYRNVMISDVRDVVVQTNPFAEDMPNELWVFLEKNTPISQNDWNLGWIRALYGDEVLDKIKDKPISCSGVTLGGFQAMYDYLLLMTKQLQLNPVKLGGIDQGVHNYLLHSGYLTSARVFATGQGPVLTLGLMGAQFKFKDGLFLNDDDSVACVAHQYDRTGLGPVMRDRYRLPEMEKEHDQSAG